MLRGHTRRRVRVQRFARAEKTERIEVAFEVSPLAVGAEDAFALRVGAVVGRRSYGGGRARGLSFRARHRNVTRIKDAGQSVGDSGWERGRVPRLVRNAGSAENKESSEVVWGPFVSASSSLNDPCSTCSRCSPLRGATRDLRSGSGLTANRKNLPYASELYPAFNISSLFSSTSALL